MYVSNYYTPVRGQDKYFNGSYEEDFRINCMGDCYITADGTDLHHKEPYSVVACPKPYKFGTQFKITMPDDHINHPGESVIATCHDRGGAIKGKRLDLWIGDGQRWWGEWSSRHAIIEVLN